MSLGIIHLVHTQDFPKRQYFSPLARTRTCAYQGVRNISYSEDFAYVIYEFHNVLFILLLMSVRLKTITNLMVI